MAFGYLKRGRRAGVKTRTEEARKQFNIPVTSSPRFQYANPHLTQGVNFNNLVAVSKTKPSCLRQVSVHFVPRVMLANTTSNLNPTSPTYQESFYLHLLSEDSLNIQSNTKLSLLSEGSLNIQSNTSRLENHLRIDTRVCLQRDNVLEDSLRDNVRDRGVNYNNLRYITMPSSILGNLFNSAYGMLNPFVTKPLFSTTICAMKISMSAPLPSPGSRLKTLLQELSAPHLVIPSKTTRIRVEPVEVSRSSTNPLCCLLKLPLAKKHPFNSSNTQLLRTCGPAPIKLNCWLSTVLLTPPLTASQ